MFKQTITSLLAAHVLPVVNIHFLGRDTRSFTPWEITLRVTEIRLKKTACKSFSKHLSRGVSFRFVLCTVDPILKIIISVRSHSSLPLSPVHPPALKPEKKVHDNIDLKYYYMDQTYCEDDIKQVRVIMHCAERNNAKGDPEWRE